MRKGHSKRDKRTNKTDPGRLPCATWAELEGIVAADGPDAWLADSEMEDRTLGLIGASATLRKPKQEIEARERGESADSNGTA